MSATETIKQVLLNEAKPPQVAAREAAILMMIVTLDILLYGDKGIPDNRLPLTDNQTTDSKQPSAPLADLSTPEGVLQRCTVEGNIVKLPAVKFDRKLYMEVAKRLELIGGKWKGGKLQGFVFNQDPTELLNQIAYGEKRNLKKEYQFYGTPQIIADQMVMLANITKGKTVLEPSAGQGAILAAIARLFPNLLVDCYELMEVNQSFLLKNKNAHLLGSDFLLSNTNKKYDIIIANPPFANNQDILHIRAMYERCKKGGCIVTCASKHWQISDNKKETEFREWLKSLGATINEIPAGTFKESGTMTKSCIIIINKK